MRIDHIRLRTLLSGPNAHAVEEDDVLELQNLPLDYGENTDNRAADDHPPINEDDRLSCAL